MTRASLAFRALDRHVIDGLADHPALVAGVRSLSYAQLLHESASLAAGLRELGLAVGGVVRLELADPLWQVVSVLAIVRLGAGFADDAPWTIDGDSAATVRTPDGDWNLELVARAGRGDPAVALDRDPDGYEEHVLARHGAILTTLLAADTLTVNTPTS